MYQKLLPTDSAYRLCIIYEKRIPKESHPYIEPIDDVMFRSATNQRFELAKIIKLYIRLRNAIFPYYLAFLQTKLQKSSSARRSLIKILKRSYGRDR